MVLVLNKCHQPHSEILYVKIKNIHKKYKF